MEWVLGSAGTLLVLSVGLELVVRLTFEHFSLTTVLLVLSLAAWSFVLGMSGLVIISLWWLVGRMRERVNQAALNRYASAEPGSHRFEKPELEVHQMVHHDPASMVPSRSTRPCIFRTLSWEEIMGRRLR
jgi:hypothetical protein